MQYLPALRHCYEANPYTVPVRRLWVLSMYVPDDSLSVATAEEEPGSGSLEWVLLRSLEAVT